MPFLFSRFPEGIETILYGIFSPGLAPGVTDRFLCFCLSRDCGIGMIPCVLAALIAEGDSWWNCLFLLFSSNSWKYLHLSGQEKHREFRMPALDFNVLEFLLLFQPRFPFQSSKMYLNPYFLDIFVCFALFLHGKRVDPVEIQWKKLECELRIPGNFFRMQDRNRNTKLRKREEFFSWFSQSKKWLIPFSIPNSTFSLCLWDTNINPRCARNILHP